MNPRPRFAASVVCVLFAVVPVAAQEFRATITGTVTDQQGAVVPGASIEARNTDTMTSVTNDNYVLADQFDHLPLGGTE